MGVQGIDPLTQLSLPPGFRFYPTDEELLVQYLLRKVAGDHFSLQIIGEIDLYKHDPWDLPSKALFGEKEWYFFSPRDRKYPNGSRPNRVAGSGYWKATGTDKVITNEGRQVGIKKALVFYIGKAPKGAKTNWIMHEYRVLDNSRKNGSSKLDDWVLCRIYKKSLSNAQKLMTSKLSSSEELSYNGSFEDGIDSVPEIEAFMNLNHGQEKVNLNHLGSGSFDWATLAGLNSVPELGHTQDLMMNYESTRGNSAYVPSVPVTAVETTRNPGAESTQHVGFQPNTNMLVQGLSNSVGPFGFRF